jgi:hypothetical protein
MLTSGVLTAFVTYRLTSLPPPGRLPFRSWLQVVVLFHVSMFGSPTGDSHPIYNAPMMGAHHAMQLTATRFAINVHRSYSASTAGESALSVAAADLQSR